jgi:hypothetical protein
MRHAHVAFAPVHDEGSGWQDADSDPPPSCIGGPMVASQYSVAELQVSEPEPHANTSVPLPDPLPELDPEPIALS